MSNHQAVEMYNFHNWANETIFKRLKELPESVYRQEMTSVFPTVAKLMAHIYIVDFCWIYVLEGVDMKKAGADARIRQEEIENMSLEELEGAYTELSRRFQDWIALGQDLDQRFMLDNPYTRKRDTRYAEVLFQVANHGTYHRGNLSAMLRQIGQSSVMTEYALYWYNE
ncbi:DinB family protein [Paenibacillus chitinolyticus]|uniref:DinB family protein n=1 Tax=Paenibacillus chitinolyticus TaxID=79263 RepID=UPI00366C3158